MSICRKPERAALGHDEWTFASTIHHPALGQLSDQDLSAARTRLRAMHAKERDFTAHKDRAAGRPANAPTARMGKPARAGAPPPGPRQRQACRQHQRARKAPPRPPRRVTARP